MLLEKFKNKYLIKGTLIALSPIHIGAGNKDFDPLQVDNTVIRDVYGNPYIPGSSLKGVLRSFMEALINSGIYSNFKTCIIIDKPCISNKYVNELKVKYPRNNEERDKKIAIDIYKKMCDVCKIFGCNFFASKLKISDCTLKDEKAYIEKRDGVVIDRDSGTSLNGRKYDFEQVAMGTKFNFNMVIDNLDDDHEELLKIIIKVLENGDLQIGGKTSVGLGKIKLEDMESYKITKENLKEYLLSGLKDEMRWKNVQ
ncbi:RAMP superfamily protein [Clostridium acetireducens DSM 10703]|uniref:RAMP superfamily protein n=1 Tax=Clostridium acetireducens DSM 10703 TaxID=1121290 RepID=A0A1E8F0X1_9CLOT|nr:CRISPR-associated RAMP protein Csx7 [Clostridium acetireducens]OFI07062.1 RAMP superfamily protein [Clostridium acetireducens DSM 10703]